MKLFECIGKGSRKVVGGFDVQPLCLDEPDTSGRLPEKASQVPSGLGVVVGTVPTGSVTAGHRQPSEPSVVHDHARLRQHPIGLVACTSVGSGARHIR